MLKFAEFFQKATGYKPYPYQEWFAEADTLRHLRPEASAQGGDGVRGFRDAEAVECFFMQTEHNGLCTAEVEAVRYHSSPRGSGAVPAAVWQMRPADRSHRPT